MTNDGAVMDQLTNSFTKSILSFGLLMMHLISLCSYETTFFGDRIVTSSDELYEGMLQSFTICLCSEIT
jgi:hypothetical protein